MEGREDLALRHIFLKTSVPGVFTIGYLPIAHFFDDKCPLRNAHHGFIPIMKSYPSWFAHQEISPPGFIPITILPIYWWIFTHQNFAHQRIAHHTGKNQKFTNKNQNFSIFSTIFMQKVNSKAKHVCSTWPMVYWQFDTMHLCKIERISEVSKPRFLESFFWISK